MSHDAWKDREKAAEDKFFQDQNRTALENLSTANSLKSPVSGESMERAEIAGVNIDRCQKTGGIWISGGELKKFLPTSSTPDKMDSALLTKVFTDLFTKF